MRRGGRHFQPLLSLRSAPPAGAGRKEEEEGARGGAGVGGARLAFRWVPEPDTFTWTALDKFSSLKPSCDLHVTPDSPCDIFSSNLERREKGTREDLMPFSSLLDQTSSEQS